MTYALLGTGGVGTIMVLVLWIQRNAARAEAKDYREQIAALGARMVIADDNLRRQTMVANTLRIDVAHLTEERNALARKDPRAAGAVLSSVLTSPDPADAPAGMSDGAPAEVAPSASKPGG
jgi:hypothetical protein